MPSLLEECHTMTVVEKFQVCFDPAAYPAGSTLRILLPLLPLRCICFFPCSCHSMLIICTCYWPANFFHFSCKNKLISRYIWSFGFRLQAQFATSKEKKVYKFKFDLQPGSLTDQVAGEHQPSYKHP